MLLIFIGLVIFSVVFVFSVSNTKYHILCRCKPNMSEEEWIQEEMGMLDFFLRLHVLAFPLLHPSFFSLTTITFDNKEKEED